MSRQLSIKGASSLALAIALGGLTPLTAAVPLQGFWRRWFLVSGVLLEAGALLILCATVIVVLRNRRFRPKVDINRPLDGIWLSTYTYRTSAAVGLQSSSHYVTLRQHDNQVSVRSIENIEGSVVELDLMLSGSVLTGTWRERTSLNGAFRASTYHGSIQLLLEPTKKVMDGKWNGFSRRHQVRTGTWRLELVTPNLRRRDIKAYKKAI